MQNSFFFLQSEVKMDRVYLLHMYQVFEIAGII